jgi:AraC-like DNA-binding protein
MAPFNLYINGKKVEVAQKTPLFFENYHIHGSLFYSIENEEGIAYIQQVKIGNCFLTYLMFYSLNEGVWLFTNTHISTGLIASLGGNFKVQTEEGKEVSLLNIHIVKIQNIPIIAKCIGIKGTLSALAMIEMGTPPINETSKKEVKDNPHSQIIKTYLMDAELLAAIQSLVDTSYYPSFKPIRLNKVAAVFNCLDEMERNERRTTYRLIQEDLDLFYALQLKINQYPNHIYLMEQLRQEFGMNAQKLNAGFKRLFGKTIYAYILSQRLCWAKQQLEETNKPLKQIASQARYRNATNFCIAYKKQFKCTPMGYRKKCR